MQSNEEISYSLLPKKNVGPNDSSFYGVIALFTTFSDMKGYLNRFHSRCGVITDVRNTRFLRIIS